jgi:hypothetical protein
MGGWGTFFSILGSGGLKRAICDSGLGFASWGVFLGSHPTCLCFYLLAFFSYLYVSITSPLRLVLPHLHLSTTRDMAFPFHFPFYLLVCEQDVVDGLLRSKAPFGTLTAYLNLSQCARGDVLRGERWIRCESHTDKV